jgi:hypothetical protein
MPLSIPFMPQKGKPPLHLRDSLTPKEIAQFQLLRRELEALARVAGIPYGK